MKPGDAETFKFIRDNLYVAAISDMLDHLGRKDQVTLRWMDTDYIVEEDPYGLEIEAMDSLRPGDVVVHSTDAGGTNAPWGELMTTVARRNGAVGCICDSQIRDCVRIMQMKFPVYYTGIRPLDSMGRARVMDLDVPVRCGDVRATLTRALRKLEDRVSLHAALKDAFGKLYGYTSDADGIRHALLDESDLGFEDAKFMLVSCASFVNYLKIKASKADITL